MKDYCFVLLVFQEEGIQPETLRLTSQPALTCSKLTIEALEKGGKYVQS